MHVYRIKCTVPELFKDLTSPHRLSSLLVSHVEFSDVKCKFFSDLFQSLNAITCNLTGSSKNQHLLVFKLRRVWIILDICRLVIQSSTLVINIESVQLIAPIHLKVLFRISIHSAMKKVKQCLLWRSTTFFQRGITTVIAVSTKWISYLEKT